MLLVSTRQNYVIKRKTKKDLNYIIIKNSWGTLNKIMQFSPTSFIRHICMPNTDTDNTDMSTGIAASIESILLAPDGT